MTNPICNFDTHLADKRVRLIKMEDTQAPPPNTMGTIQFIDGIGQIHVKWDNGSTLALQPENDQYQILD
jgi:hypothetical protein